MEPNRWKGRGAPRRAGHLDGAIGERAEAVEPRGRCVGHDDDWFSAFPREAMPVECEPRG